jgi:DNA recombination protein RmuC
LIGLLKAIAYSWKEAKLSEGYKEVARLGHELHKRLFDLNKHFQNLGRQLNSSVDHFNKAMGSYETRVLVTARKFQDLGAASAEITLDPIEDVERKAKVDKEAPLLEMEVSNTIE